MKISYNWLKYYLKLEQSPEMTSEMLTGCGLEVESLESFQSVKGGLKGVVIGEVMACEKHPNSDHLSLTKVNIGDEKPLSIVCGASNVATGQKVAVATLGTTLFFKDQELTLQKTKIRGEISEGMICAEDELGLGSSHAGIMVLDPSAKVGMSASEYFKVEEDAVFSIGLTPNRADAASHIGVARDLVAVLNNFGRTETYSGDRFRLLYPDVSAFKPDNLNRKIDVVIEDPVACPRYSALTLTGITVKPSPGWLKNKLLAVGLRPINNIVDITNFILMELGQPLHAFDGDKITGGKVIVKKYPAGTKFITLDGIERTLTENDLMICNTIEPMCMAGIFGGVKSGVSEGTTTLFLESAFFDPRHIRKTSHHHGLQTDASFRFERGADYDITIYALKRAALMIKEMAGGEISSEIVDVFPKPISNSKVELSYKNLDRLIGKAIDRNVVSGILQDLGFKVNRMNELGITLIVPANKVDVTREADVIEEVLRIYGYNNIEIPREVRSSLSITLRPDREKVQNVISEYLSSNGFHEIMNNSLSKSTYYERNSDFPVERCVKILNPISRDLDVMRQSLLFGGLEAVIYNQNRKIQDVKLFEFGTVYTTDDPDHKHNLLSGFHEEHHLALFMTGKKETENWNSSKKNLDFFEMKSYLEAILKKLELNRSIFTLRPYHSAVISDGLCYSINDEDIIFAGSISGSLLKQFDCKQNVFYAEMNWDSIFLHIPVKETLVKELPRFPEVKRDLALLVDQAITFEQIEKLSFATETKLLRKIGLFDVYEGDSIEPGKKSYALSFILQDDEKTLTDKEIEKVMERLMRVFAVNLNAQVR